MVSSVTSTPTWSGDAQHGHGDRQATTKVRRIDPGASGGGAEILDVVERQVSGDQGRSRRTRPDDRAVVSELQDDQHDEGPGQRYHEYDMRPVHCIGRILIALVTGDDAPCAPAPAQIKRAVPATGRSALAPGYAEVEFNDSVATINTINPTTPASACRRRRPTSPSMSTPRSPPAANSQAGWEGRRTPRASLARQSQVQANETTKTDANSATAARLRNRSRRRPITRSRHQERPDQIECSSTPSDHVWERALVRIRAEVVLRVLGEQEVGHIEGCRSAFFRCLQHVERGDDDQARQQGDRHHQSECGTRRRTRLAQNSPKSTVSPARDPEEVPSDQVSGG